MRKSKIFVCLLALIVILQACAPAQLPTPQVITVVVTAAPSATPAGLAASDTPAPSPTSEAPSATPAPSPTAEASTATSAPSPTAAIQATLAVIPSQTGVPLPAVSNLPAQGPQGGDIDFEVNMSPYYLMRIKARKHGSKNDGDGIDHVSFTVFDKKNLKVYSSSEKTAKYCIFKGGEPDCNPWPKSNGYYAWTSSGPQIQSGTYQVTIRVALKTDPSNESEWSFQITIKLP